MSVARRHMLKSAVAAIAVAVPAMMPGCAMAPAVASIRKAAPYLPGIDPLIALIEEYRCQTAIFDIRAETEDWEGLTERTYGPALSRLIDAPPLPTSVEGLAAGIEFALAAIGAGQENPHAVSVLRACLSSVRGSAAA
jgi:hypothetical protein